MTANQARITRSFLDISDHTPGRQVRIDELGAENETTLYGGNHRIEFQYSYGGGSVEKTIAGTFLGVDHHNGSWRIRFRRPGDFLDSSESYPVLAGTLVTFID